MRKTTALTPDTETTEEQAPTVEQEQTTPAVPKLRPKIRTVEELHDVHPKKMTSSEAVKYITHLRKECNKLNNQMQAYQENTEAAFRKVQYYEERYNALRNKAQTNLEYAKNAVRHCLTSVILAAKLED
jgi:vacuolar-type H+-ATPase subunit I/STV1